MATKRVPLITLTVGMETAEDIFDPSGRMLLSRGTVLTPKLALRVQSVFLDDPEQTVLIVVEEEEQTSANDLYEEPTPTPPPADPAIVGKLLKVAQALDGAMTAVKKGDPIDMNQVEQAVVAIVSREKSNRGIWELVEQTLRMDQSLYNHGVAVAGLNAIIAKWMGLKQRDIILASLTGYFHDIGRVQSNDERHPWLGVQILKEHTKLPEEVLAGVLEHHERNDGSGSPYGLRGNQISTFGKITAVADAFHRSCEEDPSGRCFLMPYAESLLVKSPKQFDSVATRALLDSLIPYYRGRDVVLEGEKRGKIVYIDMQYPSKPIVLTDEGAIDCGSGPGIRSVY